MFNYDLGDGADLRILEKRHAAEFVAFVDNTRAFLAEWLGWTARVTDVASAEVFIQRGLDRFAADGLPWFGIWQDDVMAGGIIFFPVEVRIKSTEIGYWLGQDFIGRGLMTRAVQASLRYVFDEVGLNRVGLAADVANAASIAVAERIGFTKEGIKRDGWLTSNGDAYVDIVQYSMLKREWDALQSQS